jgi:hypothetical protein
MIKVQAIRCPTCGDTIYSRARHDLRSCTCGEIYIDGGFDYIRIGWQTGAPPEPFKLTIDATKKQLFDDWNKGIYKYGRITDKDGGV